MANFTTEMMNELNYEEEVLTTTVKVHPSTYDDFYKNNGDLTDLYYYLLGVGGMSLCVFGVFANVIAVPIFNMHNVLSSPTTYLTAISITDTITLFCGVSLFVTMRMWPREVDQVRMYKTFTGYLVPVGQPIFECAEMCSVYLTVALLIERFQYIRHGFYVRVLCTKQTTRRVLISICVFCLLYNFPKVFAYKAVAHEVLRVPSANSSSNRASMVNSGSEGASNSSVVKREWYVRVVRTETGRSQVFIDVYGSLLKVPVEMFIPYLLLGLFCTVIAANVFESGMHQNVAASRTNLVGELERECAISTERSTVSSPVPFVTDDEYESEVDDDAANSGKRNEALAVGVVAGRRRRSKAQRRRSEQFDVAELKEQVNTVIAMYVAMLTFVCKLPQFLHTMLVSEQERFGVAPLALVRFDSVVHFLALANASLKFVVYISAGRHFREAFRTLLCVTGQSLCPGACPPSRAVSASRASSTAFSSNPTELAEVTTEADSRSQSQPLNSSTNADGEQDVRLNIVAKQSASSSSSNSNSNSNKTAVHKQATTKATELVCLRDETDANLDRNSTSVSLSKC